MNVKAVFLTTIFGFLLWLGLTLQVDPYNMAIGGVVALLLGGIFGAKSSWRDLKLTPRSILAVAIWVVVLMIEIVRSTIDVMLRVIAPRVRINPAIVEVKTRLKTKTGRLALASSITLTPGTLTADIQDDRLYIHWIDAQSTDVDAATREIVRKFEKHLEVIFG
ncbi:MAG: Na+/H+ antiporter subunit E [Deltaproteobacteria bacterium]|nr:Na+/H+ antiporter subunit E [Deltaproteobacteria bacterium]